MRSFMDAFNASAGLMPGSRLAATTGIAPQTASIQRRRPPGEVQPAYFEKSVP